MQSPPQRIDFAASVIQATVPSGPRKPLAFWTFPLFGENTTSVGKASISYRRWRASISGGLSPSSRTRSTIETGITAVWTTRALSGFSNTVRFNAWQGPHQAALKSIITGLPLRLDSASASSRLDHWEYSPSRARSVPGRSTDAPARAADAVDGEPPVGSSPMPQPTNRLAGSTSSGHQRQVEPRGDALDMAFSLRRRSGRDEASTQPLPMVIGPS